MAIEIMSKYQKPKKSHKMDIIVISIVLILIGTSVGLFLFGLGDYEQLKNMQLTWTQIAELADADDPNAPQEYIDENGDTIIVAETDQKDYLYRSINLAALQEINPDTNGYIYIPNTEVNYPIMKETEPNVHFYLDHNFYKNSDKYGSIFELCDEERGIPGIDNPINVIFGHHMASGAMFSGLYAYENQEFNTNPIFIYRDEYRVEYAVFAVCVVGQHDEVYDFSGFERDSDKYDQLLNRLVNESRVTCEAEKPSNDEDIIILSTCKGGAGTSLRLIVCAKEVRKVMVPEYYHSLEEVQQYGGESEAIDPFKENINQGGNSMQDIINSETTTENQ